MPHLVPGDSATGGCLIKNFDQGCLDSWIRTIHQPVGAFPQQSDSISKNVKRHKNRAERIQPRPPGEPGQEQPAENAKTGPGINEHVLPIGFEDQGVIFLPETNEVVAKERIDHEGRRDQARSDSEVMRFNSTQPLIDGMEEDENTGERDQPSLEAGRKERDLGVTVGMGIVGRLLGKVETVNHESNSGHVDDRLRRITEDG